MQNHYKYDLVSVLQELLKRNKPKYDRCVKWSEWITDPERSLTHRATLIRFIKHYPDIAVLVEYLIKEKLMIKS